MIKKLNKYSGYHRCQGYINNFKIRIRIREENSDVSTSKPDKWYIKDFSWQQKHLSQTEREVFKETSDLEEVNNGNIVISSTSDDKNYFLFTYVQNAEFISEEETCNEQETYLKNLLDKLHLDSGSTEHDGEYDYNESLESSIKNPVLQKDCEKMYIMADFGETIDDIWIQNEHILCFLSYDKCNKILCVYPDFSTTEPYTVRTEGDTVRIFQYFIENYSLEMPDSTIQKETELLKIIDEGRKNCVRNIIGDTFYVPPRNKLNVYLFFDIIAGKKFDNNNLYVDYTIDLPENWECENSDALKGTTQTCVTTTGDRLVHFGHNFDIVLQYNLECLNGTIACIPKNPCIYFEVISRGTWDRYRTEGMCFKDIPVSQPGCYIFNLSCFRLRSRGLIGELRRSFIGDYCNYKDVKWIGINQQEHNFENKYGVYTVSTGELNVRLNILHQSQAFLQEFYEGDRKQKFIYEKLSSSSLIRSVNQVLLAFRKARNNLIEVRKHV